MHHFCLVTAVAIAVPVWAAPPAWVARSNENAKLALESLAKFSPESAARLGLEGYDEGVADLKPNLTERRISASRDVLEELQRRRTAERDPLVRQDLDIMIRNVEQDIRGAELNQKYRIPYINAGQTIFSGIQSLLDDQIAESRRVAAVVRLRKYA